jgi:hypothetical protein
MTDKAVTKAESHRNLPIPSSRELGQSGIISGSKFIQETRKRELAMPTRFATFDKMCEDDAIFNSIDITNLHTVAALHGGKFRSKTKKGQIAADFLNYSIRNMNNCTWLDVCNHAVSDLKNGFSLAELIVKKRNYGPHSGNRVLDKIAPRYNSSMYGWVYDDSFNNVIGIVQKPPWRQKKVGVGKWAHDGIKRLSTHKWKEQKYPFIELERLLHAKHNGTAGNPQGDSPLLHCYDAWVEKKLIENYEVVGVSKDLGGMVLVRVPSEIVERAHDPDGSEEDKEEYAALQRDAADLHSGKSTSMVLLSDRDDSGNLLYDVELKGIDGKGKQYSTSDIIDQKRKSIYNVFGTGFLLLGQNNVGSNAAAQTGNSTFDYYVERCIRNHVEVINTQLAPRLLAVNNVYLNYEDMPYFEPADPSEASIDEIGKFIQRVGSVGFLTPEVLEFYMELLDAPTDGIEDLDFTDKGDSRAGESKGSSGTGNTQQGGVASATNANNGGVTKQLIKDGNEIIDAETGKTLGELFDEY